MNRHLLENLIRTVSGKSISATAKEAREMKALAEKAACDLARDFLSARSGAAIHFDRKPDASEHRHKAVDELWRSATQAFAVEHTLLESFPGQIENAQLVDAVLTPVRLAARALARGRFYLTVTQADLRDARFDPLKVQVAILEEVLRLAAIDDNRNVVLSHPDIPFKASLRRHGEGSELILISIIDGDPDELRAVRFRRALQTKLPKLATAARQGHVAVLVLEANDSQHSSIFKVAEVAERVLDEHRDLPEVIVLVESDCTPAAAWMLKEGLLRGNRIPPLNGHYRFEQRF